MLDAKGIPIRVHLAANAITIEGDKYLSKTGIMSKVGLVAKIIVAIITIIGTVVTLMTMSYKDNNNLT